MAAAETALEFAVRETLGITDWSGIAAGSTRSAFVDGAVGRIADARRWVVCRLDGTDGQSRRSWLAPVCLRRAERSRKRAVHAYIVVWAAPYPPGQDAVLALRADAFGPSGTRRAVQAIISRTGSHFLEGSAVVRRFAWVRPIGNVTKRRWTKGLFLTSLVTGSLLCPAPVGAQSLADVARAEEARRKALKAPVKVYTNEDLGKGGEVGRAATAPRPIRRLQSPGLGELQPPRSRLLRASRRSHLTPRRGRTKNTGASRITDARTAAPAKPGLSTMRCRVRSMDSTRSLSRSTIRHNAR